MFINRVHFYLYYYQIQTKIKVYCNNKIVIKKLVEVEKFIYKL